MTDAASNPSTPSPLGVLLPDLVRVRDLCALLDLSPRAVRKGIRAGRFGPYSRCGRQIVIRREALLAALAEREVDPRSPRAVPRPRKDLLELLDPSRRRGGRRSRGGRS
jgi:hypothetical protein